MDRGLATPVALIIDDAQPINGSKPIADRLRSGRAAWNLYNRLFVRHRSRALREEDLSQSLQDVPTVRCITRKGKGSGQYFSEQDVAAIQLHRPDFILRFAFNIIRGDILTAARYGVWSFHHDDLDVYRGPPACFWPAYHGDPVQGVTLQRLTEGIDCGVILKRCWLKCTHHDYARNRDNAFMFSADMPAQVCRDIVSGHTAGVLGSPSTTNAPIRTVPQTGEAVRYAIQSATAAVRHATASRLYDDQWALGIIERPVESILRQPLPEPRWICPMPRGRFLADPFIARSDEGLLILAEEFTSRTGRGHISAIRIDNAGCVSEPAPVIMEPHHLSYPYLVERNGELFCIPESAESGEIAVYAPQGGMRPWRRAGTLIKGIRALDTTVIEYAGQWWMFVCTRSGHVETRLEIFHAPDLFGPWTPHSHNPVKSDIRSSRPAGKPFVHEGVLYRPAQDCSLTYGGSIVLNRVECLTVDEYRESPATRLQPDPAWPFPRGLHTLGWAANCMVVDAKRRILLPRAVSPLFPLDETTAALRAAKSPAGR